MGSHFVYRVCSPSQAPGLTRRKQGDSRLLTLPRLLRAPSLCAAHSALINCSDSEGLRKAEEWTHPQSGDVRLREVPQQRELRTQVQLGLPIS